MRGRTGERADLSGQRLLGLPVRLRGIQLGRAVELLVDPARARAVAIEVLCGDGRRRILPLAAAAVGDHEISVASALHLADEQDGAFYRERAARLGMLRGSAVARGGRPLGTLRDVVLGRSGEIAELLVETRSGVLRVACESGVEIGSALLRC